MLGAGLEPWANTELGPWADLLGAGTSRALEVSLPQSSEGYETPSPERVVLRRVSGAPRPAPSCPASNARRWPATAQRSMNQHAHRLQPWECQATQRARCS